MGRVKTVLIKREAHELMKLYGNEFSENYEKNKEVINKLISTPSKRLRNAVTGYVTKLFKLSKKSE